VKGQNAAKPAEKANIQGNSSVPGQSVLMRKRNRKTTEEGGEEAGASTSAAGA